MGETNSQLQGCHILVSYKHLLGSWWGKYLLNSLCLEAAAVNYVKALLCDSWCEPACPPEEGSWEMEKSQQTQKSVPDVAFLFTSHVSHSAFPGIQTAVSYRFLSIAVCPEQESSSRRRLKQPNSALGKGGSMTKGNRKALGSWSMLLLHVAVAVWGRIIHLPTHFSNSSSCPCAAQAEVLPIPDGFCLHAVQWHRQFLIPTWYTVVGSVAACMIRIMQ